VPKQTIDDKTWEQRISSAERYHEKWESLFKCKKLEDYYESRQWKANSDYNPYTINKIYESIQIKLDQFVPIFPKYLVSARPGNSDFDLEHASLSANLKQDILNSLVQDDRSHFTEELANSYRDSYFRFGVFEVGYSADWILNPNAPKPLLDTTTDPDKASSDRPKVKTEPKELPSNERIYFKHIPAKRFRIGGIDHKYLSQCSWYGYYDWIDKNQLLALKIMNRDKVDTSVGGFLILRTLPVRMMLRTTAGTTQRFGIFGITKPGFNLSCWILQKSHFSSASSPAAQFSITDRITDL
jgi:hypothetical protein